MYVINIDLVTIMTREFTLKFIAEELKGPFPGCTWLTIAIKLRRMGVNHYTVGLKKHWCSPPFVTDGDAYDSAVSSEDYDLARSMVIKPMCHNDPGNYECCSMECWINTKLYEIKDSTLRNRFAKVFGLSGDRRTATT